MNKKTLQILILSISCLIPILIIFTAIKFNPPNQSIDINQNTNNEKTEYFIAKKYNDKIAIFKNSSSEPIIILNIYFNILPEQDKQQIEKGIILNSEKDLKKFIEDFDS